MKPDLNLRPDVLAVFPLPDVVLLPGDSQPLHIFEPRYQAMLAHVLRGDRLLGMGTLQRGDLHPSIGVGRVERVQALPEGGRSNILIRYVGRARLLEELDTDQPFRQFRVEWVVETPAPAAELRVARMLLYQLASTTSGAAEGATHLAALDDMELVHAIARQILRTPSDKLGYLEASPSMRVDLVSAQLTAVMASKKPVADA